MELESCVTILNLLMLIFSNGSVYSTSVTDDEDLQSTLIERLDDIQHQLYEVINAMRSLDSDIGNTLMNCMGKHTELCDALDGELKTLIGLTTRLASDKFLHTGDHEFNRHKSLFKELGRKRAMVNHLLGVFRGANNVLQHERKRTCNLNLGFHCQTEEISNFADMYDYLSSSKSPGKKRSIMRTH